MAEPLIAKEDADLKIKRQWLTYHALCPIRKILFDAPYSGIIPFDGLYLEWSIAPHGNPRQAAMSKDLAGF